MQFKEYHSLILYALVLLLTLTSAQDVGDVCYLTDGSLGECEHITTCESAQRQMMQRIQPILCGYDGFCPVVCCEPGNMTQSENQESDKYVRTKADEMCDVWLRGGRPEGQDVAYGGVDALPEEFPHMAILGYGNGEDLQFQCGGSLISEQFILTAAHCLYSRQLGDVTSVRLGDLDIGSTTDKASPQEFKVAATHVHPEYSPNSHYHDIALLKLDKPAVLNEYVRPACLQTIPELYPDNYTATGWGATYFGGDIHSFLQKVELDVLPVETCMQTYKPNARLLKGINDTIQVCAGNLQKPMDTCQGDSGGPLQIQIGFFPVVHTVVGITSFGKDCGLVPAVYTRVSTYINWIESIVWP